MPFDIASQIESWRTQLLDTTKRNRLINFKTGGTGGIVLAHPDPGELWHSLVAGGQILSFPWKRELIDLPEEAEQMDADGLRHPNLFDPDELTEPPTGFDILDRCRHSPHLRADHILTELSDQRLASRLTRLHLNTQESLTEQGVTILYVAFGFLRWFESPDSHVEIRSPLLLVPVRLERDSVEALWKIQAEEEEILQNHSLIQLLANDFGLRLPTVDDDKTDPDDPTWRTSYFAAIQNRVRHQERWEVLDEAALGTFNFQKLAMWEDLGRNQERIKNHDLCQAIAGNHSIGPRNPSDLPGREELDQKVLPQQTCHILDADSSQHAAIVAATRGANLVLDGPPGTGKSQTIANTIAEFLAAGKTVLFVSEKMAALEVVKRRLDAKGLGDFCLACHSHKANKREVIDELGRCLSIAPEAFRDPSDELRQLFDARTQLNAYVRELHALRLPLKKSAYKVHGQLAGLVRLTSTSRCPIPKIMEHDSAYLDKITDLLARLPDCRPVIENQAHHPWRGCRAIVSSQTLRTDVEHHFSRLAACLEPILKGSAILHKLNFCGNAPTLTDWLTSLKNAQRALACPQLPANWFKTDPQSVAGAYIQLDRVTQNYRQVRASLAEFAPDSLRAVDPNTLNELTTPTDDKFLGLLPHADDSVRTLGQRLTRVSNELRELQRQAEITDQALQRVVALLPESIPPQPVKGLRKFAEFAGMIARMKPVKRSWWDPARRQVLQQVITRRQEELRSAQELQVELMTRLSPQAFAPENAPLAAQGTRFGSFLARLLPRWWSFKGKVANWYTQGMPKRAALLDDLGKLARFHRCIDFCRQVQAQYAADLVVDEGGQPDWEATFEGLGSVQRLEQFIKKVPQALQAILSTGGSLDRESLMAAASALAQSVTILRQQMDVAGQEYDLREVLEDSSLQVRNLSKWVEPQLASLVRKAATLERVVGLLTEGRDVPTAILPQKLRALTELARLRAEIVHLRDRLSLSEESKGLEEYDWSSLRERAEGLLRFLIAWRRPLSPPIVAALTVPEVRSHLEEAVRGGIAARASGFDESWRFLTEFFDPDLEVSTGIVIGRASLTDLRKWLTDRATDAHRIDEWTQFCEIKHEVTQAGVATILTEVLQGQVKVEEASDVFRARFLRLWLDGLYEQVSALRQFRTDNHERLIEKFRELDRRSVQGGSARIRNLLLTRTDRPSAGSGDAPESSELFILLHEVNKKRRHLPLRKLFAAIPSLLPRIKPCLMMSPLAVSIYLQSPDQQFDLVIFDEASQVRPHDAICAIYRGRQLIVAGDQKQLPPTSFFERSLAEEGASSEEEEETNLSDYESVLDVCCTLGLLRRRLRWHYRSRREPLIAFANKHVYNNELVTFPSVHDMEDNPAIAFEYVPEGRWKGGQGGGFNAVEAHRTAELILEHFLHRPNKSLGVIAFNQKQQLRILDELEQLRRARPQLEEFFREDGDEPFFVKNLENVQGDERDVIFLSVGYGPDDTGKVAMRFGPLNMQGGERRLNVAVTRARERVIVISSLCAQDIDLSRTGAKGVKLFRAYLDYAERGKVALVGEVTEDSDHDFESPFEQEVYEELTRCGLMVHRQVGCSGFRIDLAVVDASAPGRYLLGIECDGATYHSSATARDRDRLRQEVLEGLGWQICRIWSTDWLRDRDFQVRRVKAALEKAKQMPLSPPRATTPAQAITPKEENLSPADALAAPPSTLTIASSYDSIDEVPDHVLQEMLLRGLRSFGATGATELTQAVSKQLGFKRTGKRIQARIEEVIEGLKRTGSICCTADQRLQLAHGSQAVNF